MLDQFSEGGLLGIQPTLIPYDLKPHLVGEGKTISDKVSNKEERFLALVREWDTDAYDEWEFSNTHKLWENHWRYTSYELLSKAFSFEELCMLWRGSSIESHLSRYIEGNHPFLAKVENSLYRFGYSKDWNKLVRGVDGICRLGFLGLEGFEVRITYSAKWRTHGYSEHVRELYLDAPFGLLVYYQGKHVLTVGFALADEGVLISQVQLRSKKGNRFLYKLPEPLLDIVLKVFRQAFGRQALWLIEGTSAVSAVKLSYGSSKCSMGPEDEARIAGLYNRRLGSSFSRSEKTITRDDRTYVKLSACHTKAVGANTNVQAALSV